jgi:hypothetical protein
LNFEMLSSSRARWLVTIAIAVTGAIVPLLLPLLDAKTKKLAYDVTSTQLVPGTLLKNKLQFAIDDRRLDAVEITTVTIMNTGNVAIARADFDQDMLIHMPKESELLLAHVSATHPKILATELVNDATQVRIKPVLLNPRDFIQLSLLSTSSSSRSASSESNTIIRVLDRKRVSVSAHAAGMRTPEMIENREPTKRDWWRLILGASLIFFYGIAWGNARLLFSHGRIFGAAGILIALALMAAGSELSTPVVQLLGWNALVGGVTMFASGFVAAIFMSRLATRRVRTPTTL